MHHTSESLLIFVLQVGTLNRTGKPYQGSYDIWLRNRIASLTDETASAFIPRTTTSESLSRSIDCWVNGNDYERTTEVFGLLPLPDATRTKLGMLPYRSDFARSEKIRHPYLAAQQRTLVAILPIHTPEERALFRILAKRPNGPFSGPRQPNWITVAQEWSTYCDGKHVYYKVCHPAVALCMQ